MATERAERHVLANAKLGLNSAKTLSGFPKEMEFPVLNISMSGVLFKSSRQYNENEKVYIGIAFTVFNAPVLCSATVAWCRPANDGSVDFHVAIEFTDFKTEKDRLKIKLINSSDRRRNFPELEMIQKNSTRTTVNFVKAGAAVLLISLIGAVIYIFATSDN